VYKFTVNSKGKVNIRFKPEDASEVGSKTGWDVNLYDYSGRLIKKCGEHKKLKSTTLTLPKGSYYILVDAYEEWSQPVDLTYCIKVNHCGNTSISKITSKNKSATIKWKALREDWQIVTGLMLLPKTVLYAAARENVFPPQKAFYA